MTVLVFADVSITRRKWYHLIARENGDVLYRDRRWSGVLEWLYDSEISDYTVIAPDGRETRCTTLTAQIRSN